MNLCMCMYIYLFIEYIIERCLRLNRKCVLFLYCYFNNNDGVLNFCKNCDLDFIESIIKVILCYILWIGRYSRYIVLC